MTTPEREPDIVILLPLVDAKTPQEELALRTLADAIDGEQVVWPDDEVETWNVLAHLCNQIPSAIFTIALPTGGRITRRSPVDVTGATENHDGRDTGP
jgi:hypothetical protein